jgi:tetratricopeptide (TPR) repeat protein
MKVGKLVGGLLLLGVLGGLAGWYGWRWYTTPRVPEFSLAGADPEVAVAIEAARQEVRRQPRSGQAWGMLGMVLGLHGYEESYQCFINAERFDPASARWPYFRAVAQCSGDPHRGIPLLRQALALAENEQHRSAIRFRLALDLIEVGELDEAAQHLHELRRIEPESPRVHFGLGLLATARQDTSAAREHLSKLTQSPFARKRVCLLLASLPGLDRSEATRYSQQAATLANDFPWPDPLLIEMNAHRVDRKTRLDQFEQLEDEGKHVEALHLLRQLVAESPDAEVCFALAQRLLQRDEPEQAEAMLRTVLRLEPENVKLHYMLALALFKHGEKCYPEASSRKAALELFRQAVAAVDVTLIRKCDHAEAYLIRGRALKYLKRTEESLLAFRQALLCRPEAVEMHLALGEALAEAGQRREAIHHLENAVRLAGPDDKRPREVLKKWQAKLKTTS